LELPPHHPPSAYIIFTVNDVVYDSCGGHHPGGQTTTVPAVAVSKPRGFETATAGTVVV